MEVSAECCVSVVGRGSWCCVRRAGVRAMGGEAQREECVELAVAERLVSDVETQGGLCDGWGAHVGV